MSDPKAAPKDEMTFELNGNDATAVLLAAKIRESRLEEAQKAQQFALTDCMETVRGILKAAKPDSPVKLPKFEWSAVREGGSDKPLVVKVKPLPQGMVVTTEAPKKGD